MSAADGQEVLRPILLRSSTPAANEKVLLYLEGMNRESTHLAAPSVAPSDEYNNGGAQLYAPSPRSGAGSNGARQLDELARSQVSYGEGGAKDDDIDSNVQEGKRSELGTTLKAPLHEPGPNDLPGPRYESFDSGPSFGNFGPLPDINTGLANWGTWQPNGNNTPNKAAGVPLPESTLRSPTVASKPWGGTNLGTARGIPLPDSVISPTSVGINVQEPTASGASKSTKSPSRVSHRTKSVMSEDRTTVAGGGTKSASKVSKAPTAKEEIRPMKTGMSVAQSAKSRGTTQTRGVTEKGTNYPPLPESAVGESSPRKPHKAMSRAYSISPSDSPSQPPKPNRFLTRTRGATHERNPSIPEGSVEPSSPRSAPRQPAASVSGSGANTHQSRPFSPYRHAATQEDLLHAVLMGATNAQAAKAPSSRHTEANDDADATPTQSRAQSPAGLTPEEEQMVRNALTPYTRTSYSASALEPDVVNSHFHDMDLCILLHQVEDPMVHEVVRKALRKAIRQRVKKLGIKHDVESIRQYRKSFHDHDPSVHLQPNYAPSLTQQEPPDWAKELMEGMIRMQERLDGLGPKIERLQPARSVRSYADGESRFQGTFQSSDIDRYAQTPMTQTVNIHTQPTGTMAESMYQPGETEVVAEGQTIPGGSSQAGDHYEDEEDGGRAFSHDGEIRTPAPLSEFDGRDDSPGQQYLEEELYKLRVKPGGSQSGLTHRTWELAKDGDGEFEDDPHNAIMESGLPEIPDSGYTDNRPPSPPLPPLPLESRDLMASPQGQVWHGNYNNHDEQPPPWQRIHQRLLSWAIVWPMSELETALNSSTRGQQVDEVALSIWSTQTYKRYVRSKMTDSPQGRVDRLFVPPNVADAINNAVFHGRHGDASGMLRDLWNPFGLDGMPRLLVVLAKHRSDANHWVVHRFSLPDGALTTYDSFPERTLPDGRPLGWWFAIRVAWPSAIYPSPDHLMQKMVRLHRPMQLGIDNSVAAAGIWRNLLMGSRAERSLDLERLRDLIHTEVKNLRQRKLQGKLSIGGPKPNWEDMN